MWQALQHAQTSNQRWMWQAVQLAQTSVATGVAWF
jgi:hypothetical protein